MSYSASANRARIEAFNATWPCSNLQKAYRVWAQWDECGDLVDIEVVYRNGRRMAAEVYDGPAIVALVADMQATMHPEHTR
jgi:hypothetical protein